jgi:hypothetical protein
LNQKLLNQINVELGSRECLKDYVIEMKDTIKTGLCFGLTSAIITTLGLIVGLHSFAGSKMVIIGGIFTIAIADAFSDALGIHVSEEAENSLKKRKTSITRERYGKQQ